MKIKTLLLFDLDYRYSRLLQEMKNDNRSFTRKEICKKLSLSPAPRFYCSVEYARRVIADLGRGIPRAYSNRRSSQHRELYNRFMSLPEEERTNAALEKIINSPAPSFYLSPYRINILLYRYLKQYEYHKRK